MRKCKTDRVDNRLHVRYYHKGDESGYMGEITKNHLSMLIHVENKTNTYIDININGEEVRLPFYKILQELNNIAVCYHDHMDSVNEC